MDVVAPGSNLASTNIGSGYAYITGISGTSFAAPQVAGIAALMLSENPNLTREEITMMIESSARKLGSYSYTSNTGHPSGTWNNETGHGLVDAYAAVHAAWAVENLPPSNWYGMHFESQPEGHGSTIRLTYNAYSTTTVNFRLPAALVNANYTYYWSFTRDGNSALPLPASTSTNNWNAYASLYLYFGSSWTLDMQCRVYDGGTLVSIPRYTLNVEF